jgi:hypothetical protein
MVRKIVIASVAAAAVLVGSAFEASAKMGSMGGMSRSGMGHSVGRMGPMSSGIGRTAVGSFPRAAVAPGKVVGVAPGKVLHPKVPIKHARLHKRFFVFAAAGYPYGYYDSCYERVWTRWGWRLTYVCGDYPY